MTIINQGLWNDYYSEVIRRGRQRKIHYSDTMNHLSCNTHKQGLTTFERKMTGKVFNYRPEVLDWLEKLEDFVFIFPESIRFHNNEDLLLYKITWGQWHNNNP